MRQRRRAERQLLARSAAQGSSARRISEPRVQRLLYVAGGALVVGLAALLSVAWYFNSYRLPRTVVAEFDGTEIRLADAAPQTRMDAIVSGTFDAEQALNNLLLDHIMRARAPGIGASVGPEDVEAALAEQFEEPAEDGADAPSELTEEGREAFERFIEGIGVSESEYRLWREGRLWQEAAYEVFLAQAPVTAESVFLEWIVGADSVQAQAAYDRIASGEDFGTVANDLNTDTTIAGANGEVGWVPRGALPELNEQLFAEDLVVGEVLGPVAASFGTLVYRVTEKSDDQLVDEGMRGLLARYAFQNWVNEQSAGVEVDLTDDEREWVYRDIGAS